MKTTVKINAPLDEKYSIAKQWLSDIEFFSSEIRFFDKLIQRNILFAESEQFLPPLEALQNELRKLLSEHAKLNLQIHNQIEKITSEERKGCDEASDCFLSEHEILHQKIAGFVVNYRAYKQRLFQGISRVMELNEAALSIS